jgi:hypothetical protein
MARCSAIACATISLNWAENSHRSFSMQLPETIAMRFTEEDAGYVTVRPVVKQTFRLSELADMVVSVTGKNVSRVQQIFRAGTVVYNGYRYWWEGFVSSDEDVTALLTVFPDDDPALPFNPAHVTAVSLEIGGGTQRSLVSIARGEAATSRLFQKKSSWEILLATGQDSTPRYEKYSHADRADVYRVQLSFDMAASLLKEVIAASPRGLRKRLLALQPPAAILFFIPRTKTAGAATSP